jgi:phosphoribosyl 1,2-cyclic phosphodiesterase
LRSKNSAIAIDPGKSLDQPEVSVIAQLDLLLFSHSHWDHYKKGYALSIFRQTRPHVVADIVSSAELKAHIPPSMLTTADPASKSATYHIGDTAVTALPAFTLVP